MNRRKFLTVSALASAGVAACGSDRNDGATAPNVIASPSVEWIMVTTWPPGFPILHDACLRVADAVAAMSGGKFNIKVYGAGELIPAFECFEAVSLGTAAISSGASYYWAGRIPAAPFFASLPFGLNAQGMNTWLLAGGGLEVYRAAYAPHNLRPYVAGNTGVQMAGWFNKELSDIDSLRGLKMRIPGLGGRVFEAAGGTTLLSPGNELYVNLERGVIDATEWIGPYHDYLMGFHEVAKYYYGPGWHEPGTVLEMMVHQPTYDALPQTYQKMLDLAIAEVNDWTLRAFEAANGEYIRKIIAYGTDVRPVPQPLLSDLKPLAAEVIAEAATGDAQARAALSSYEAFAKTYGSWTPYGERGYWTAITT